MRLPVSLVVITLNEAHNIERCLRSAPFVDEIIVLDSGSRDQTVEVSQKVGAKTFTEDWRGFGPQKRRAVELAKNDWILSLDADEALSSESVAEILQKWPSCNEKMGYYFPRKSFYLGRWIMHGGWYPDFQKRLFHRKYSNWQGDIHEKVHSPQDQYLEHPIEHFVFENISDQVKTNDKYSTLQATQHFNKGQRFSLFKLVVKPWVKFLECYFLKQGFRDGLAGFIIAVSAGYSVFIRWGKVWELEKK